LYHESLVISKTITVFKNISFTRFQDINKKHHFSKKFIIFLVFTKRAILTRYFKAEYFAEYFDAKTFERVVYELIVFEV